MSILSKIKRGDASLPDRVLLAGPEGIGKSTFASGAPAPLFICAEDGLKGLDHVQRLSPESLQEVHQIIDELIVDRKGYKTLVIDTADWLERLIYAGICQRDGKSNIEDYGYGKGYVIAENELVNILGKLDKLRSKGMGIVILSHVQIKTFNDPTGESWDRYEMKGHKRMTGILREWTDACLFAVREVVKTKAKSDRNEKTIDGGKVIHTEWSPAWDAKNRLNLPAKIEVEELNWEDFDNAVKANSIDTLREQFKSAVATAVAKGKMPETVKQSVEKFLSQIETHSAATLKKAIQRVTVYAN